MKEQSNNKRRQARRTFVKSSQQNGHTEKSSTGSRFTYISSIKRTTDDNSNDNNNAPSGVPFGTPSDTSSDMRTSRIFIENTAAAKATTASSAAESSSIQERNQSTATTQSRVQKSAQKNSQMNTGETKAEEQADVRNTKSGTQPSDSRQSDTTQSNIWHRIAGGLRTAGHSIAWVWNKRIKLPYTLYAVVFLLVTFVLTLAMQWSVMSEPTYAPDADVDDYTRAMQSVVGQLTSFVSDVWLRNDWTFVLNFLVIGLMYFVVVALLNRFWVATAIVGAGLFGFAIANYCKIRLRNEPIIPADLSFISGGNTGEIVSFIPEDQLPLVEGALTAVLWFVGVCVVLQFLDKRNGLIPVTYRPSRFVSAKNFLAIVTRFLVFLLSFTLLFSFTWNLSIRNSWAQEFTKKYSDKPEPWNALGDASNNGPMMNFLRLSHVKVMEQPANYSKETMQALAQKYGKKAEDINSSRTQNLTDSTVIMILSESFSDPTRVPGVHLSIDPMPHIRSIEQNTTSGLALSPGYGGGTANIEFQALTGLNAAIFDPSLISMYQQLAAQQKRAFSFNQMWNARYGKEASTGLHPFHSNMYLRRKVYQTFGFSKFLTLDSEPEFEPQDYIDGGQYVSDAASYQAVLNQLTKHKDPQFIKLITIQNHQPYNSNYPNNEFVEDVHANNTDNLTDWEKYSLSIYAKDIQYTDQATTNFLNQLNQINRPITVILYGDHLPGIYTTASNDINNIAALHETDYFIWSNQASISAGVKLSPEKSNYSSSNYFMATAAEHMNAKVTPYLALLTELHNKIPSISRMGSSNTKWENSSAMMLLAENGTTIGSKSLTKEQKTYLDDYRLIQYDITAGKGYLYDTKFFE